MSNPLVSHINIKNSNIATIATTIAIAFGGLIGCQTTTPNSASSLDAKIIAYGRSQLNLDPSQAIKIESQQPQPVNTGDICQVGEPTQSGFVIKIVAADTRYILHSNADASKIELCGSEDAQPADTAKYIGTGYTLRYPANWQAIDFGLERSGASTVIFTPQQSAAKLNEKLNPETTLKTLQGDRQTHAVIRRIPIAQANLAQLPQDAQAISDPPFDHKAKAAKSGAKVLFTEAIAGNDGTTNWQVQALNLETEQFIYTIRYYQQAPPDQANNQPNQFEQFVSSFALIS